MGKERITSVIHEAPKERTEQAPKQDEAGKLLKELAKFFFPRPGKGTEQNRKSEAAIPNGTNERPAIIRRNQVKEATGSYHVGVSGCNNGVRGTGCDIEDNEVTKSIDSQFVGVSNCGNESNEPNYFNISHLIFVCLVLLCFAMYKY